MHPLIHGFTAFVVATLMGATPLVAQTGNPRTSPAQPALTRAASHDALREHVEEAEELVDSLLNWQHVVTWSDRGKSLAPPPEGPTNTLISIEQTQAKKLTALLEALATQLPAESTKTPAARGDLRAHLEKAQEIARELHPPHAAPTVPATGTASGLVTIDRTALQRLDVELEAMKLLLPRAIGDGERR